MVAVGHTAGGQIGGITHGEKRNGSRGGWEFFLLHQNVPHMKCQKNGFITYMTGVRGSLGGGGGNLTRLFSELNLVYQTVPV